jgi:hypothetical protein
MPEPELLVLTPSRSEPSPQTRLAFALNMDGLPWRWISVVGRPVDVARNELAAIALREGSPESLCLWIDDDCYWSPGTIPLLVQVLRHVGTEVVTALFGPRVPFATPLCMMRLHDTSSAPREGRDYIAGQVIPIESAGMNFVLHRTALLSAIGPEPFTPLRDSLGEDHSFFERLRTAGARVSLATGIAVAHCDGELAFLPGRRPFQIVDNKLVPWRPELSDTEVDALFDGVDAVRSYGPNVDRCKPQA